MHDLNISIAEQRSVYIIVGQSTVDTVQYSPVKYFKV